MKKDYLLELIDGKLISIDSEDFCKNIGCPTCGYGSEFINDLDINLTNYRYIVTINRMYGYAFSIGDLLNIILGNIDTITKMTQLEFIDWFKNKVKEKADEITYKIIERK